MEFETAGSPDELQFPRQRHRATPFLAGYLLRIGPVTHPAQEQVTSIRVGCAGPRYACIIVGAILDPQCRGGSARCRLQAGPQVGIERKLVPIEIADEILSPATAVRSPWIA